MERGPISKEDWKAGFSEDMPPGCGMGCLLVALLASFGWAAVLMAVALLVASMAG